MISKPGAPNKDRQAFLLIAKLRELDRTRSINWSLEGAKWDPGNCGKPGAF
jgi:hypothetical protein